MKNFLSLAFLAFIFLCTSCGSDNSPQSVAQNFFDHLAAAEFSEAKVYGSKETRKVLDLLGQGGQDDNPYLGAKMKVSDCNERGDICICSLSVTDKEGDTQDSEIELVKEDGVWQVKMEKGDMMNKEDLEKETGKSMDEMMDELKEEMEDGNM